MSKICSKCGKAVEDNILFCPVCGSGDLTPVSQEQANVLPEVDSAAQAQLPAPNENIIAGIVGAFLLSLGGALLYFIIYQVGVIAGICGLVTFVLAHLGYCLFTHSKKSTSVASIVVSIIVTLVMIFVAEYLCLSFEIYQELGDFYGINFFEAVKATPIFLEESEILTAVIKDLAFAYIFGIIAMVGQISNMRKARKQQQQ